MSLNEPTEYNEYIGQETIDCEYKEFTFNLTGLLLDTKLAEQYCESNKFDFNKNVIFNLKKYFKVYLPKYACGYFNSGIDGDCYIGINDYGFVKGIPFKGKFPIQILKNMMIKVLSENIKNLDDISINLDQLIQIKIIKIKHNLMIDSKQNNKFLNYLEEKEKYVKEYTEFVEKTNIWRQRMIFSVNKLVDLANNKKTRNQIIQWIKSVDQTNPVIAIFESNYKFEYKTHENIVQIKDNPLEPYYWITRWKDMIIDSIKAEKPVLNSTFNMYNTPINLLVGINEMIPYWFTYNSNMNLYVIQIKFFGSKLAVKNINNDMLTSNYNNFIYRDSHAKKWIRCYRTILSNGEPVCLPL